MNRARERHAALGRLLRRGRHVAPAPPANPSGVGLYDNSVCTDSNLHRWTSQAQCIWNAPSADVTAVFVTWTINGTVQPEQQLAANATSSLSAAQAGLASTGHVTYSCKVKFRNAVGDSAYVVANPSSLQTSIPPGC